MNGGGRRRMVLFVCTGNTCRSPMAAALYNHLNPPPDWHAESAGIAAFAGEPASLPARTALQMDFGLDLAGHESRPVTPGLLEQAAWILTMTHSHRDSLRQAFPEHRARILTVGELAGEPDLTIADPFGRDLAAYRETAAVLARLIAKIDNRNRQNI